MKRDETKQELQTAIKDAVNSISNDIQREDDPGKNLTRAEAIKRLTEAYKNTK